MNKAPRLPRTKDDILDHANAVLNEGFGPEREQNLLLILLLEVLLDMRDEKTIPYE
jgi:hypothetical protein